MNRDALDIYVTAALNRAPDLNPAKRDEITRNLKAGAHR